MTDKELLEKAAKAAGYVAEGWCDEEGLWLMDDNPNYGYEYWNPLDDDGDALRLAVKLNIDVVFEDDGIGVWAFYLMEGRHAKNREYVGIECMDISKATRRAITRAAAAMVKE